MHRDVEKLIAWQRRSKRLKGGKPPRRKTRVKPVNKARAAKKFARNFHSAERVEWVQAKACVFCQDGPCLNSHMIARGNGGAKGDWTKILPVCFECDTAWARGHKTFLRSIGWTWADVEYQLAALMREWMQYERESVEVVHA